MTDRRLPVVFLVLVLAAAGSAHAQDTRRLSADDAVRLALENNLGIQVARLNPQLQDLSVAQAQAAWVPTVTSSVQTSSTDTPNTSFLSGSQGNKTTDRRLLSNVGVTQLTPWGGSYAVGWDASRATTTAELRRIGSRRAW